MPNGLTLTWAPRYYPKGFHHVCNPCDECDSTGKVHDAENCGPDGCVIGCVECPKCAGDSKPCSCEAAWEEKQESRGRDW